MRRYVEIAQAEAPASSGAGMAGMGGGGNSVSPGKPDLKWTVPEGWQEMPAMPMRLATFRAGETECAITAFPGQTGGLQANLARWLRQLGQPEPTEDGLKKLTDNSESLTTQGGLPASIYDLAAVLPAGSATGMVTAIVRSGDFSVFVKLTGPVAAIAAEKARFGEFVRSLAHE